MDPDPWQMDLLRSVAERRMLLNCSRQSGKTTLAAAIALRTALLEEPALILMVSPTQRQSAELFRDKFVKLYRAFDPPTKIVQRTALTMELDNGSRIIALPGDEANIRGYSGVSLIVIDEAARVPDELYRAVRPMLAVSRGTLIALSTPWGKRGWFYEEWMGVNPWKKIRITASQCPRISQEYLAEEKESSALWYSQEFDTVFCETIDSVFRQEDIDACLTNEVQPLWKL